MISRIEGELVATGRGRVEVRCGSVTYALLVPAADEQRLAAMTGETVTLATLHYLEGQGQGSSFIPRLIGFAHDEDRAFFELFTTVKGMGNRKALRAMTLPFPIIAAAIADKDLDLLKSLPEVGRRTAETIVAELHGKVDRFVELKPLSADGIAAVAAGELAGGDDRRELVVDAVGMLRQLGETSMQARHLVECALRADPSIDTAELLVAAAYRLKEPV